MSYKTNYKRQFLIHFFIWITILLIIAIQLYIDRKTVPFTFLYRIGLNIIFFYINYLVLVPKLLLKKRIGLFILSTILLLVIANIVSLNILPPPEHFFDFRRNRIIKSMPSVFLLMLLFIGTAIRIYEEWKKNDNNKKEIEAQKNLSELEALKRQINPHFLFNSLNSIYSLTTKKSNDAPEAVITLSELMRYMLYQADDEFVLLQQELTYIENYIKLQRLRIVNNESVKVNIRGNVTTQKIRPLLFISLIENAFKYGTDYKGNTEVKIVIFVQENELQFICSNLIGSMKVDAENSGIGLKNTKERLQLLYPDKHTLIVNEDNDRYVVNLTLKLD
ncbi:sensor histidine kinase [Pontimicrobium sp. IMCC45349]|uniref:sensor histidine kinase n=1 Tax=Pontimicrobium sp. IMCC45349 TaxID=3391574 RepID=UPI0039A3CFFD